MAGGAEFTYEGSSIDELLEHTGSHEAVFDLLAGHIVEDAVSKGYVADDEACRDAADLLTRISSVAEQNGDTVLNDAIGLAAELWSDDRTHEQFSFGVEIIRRDGRYVVWRPQ